MLYYTTFAMYLILSFSLTCQAEQGASEDLARLRGKWKVILWKNIGTKAVPQEKDVFLVIQNNRLAVCEGNIELESVRFQIRPDKSPKEIDMFDTENNTAPPLLGIYEVTDRLFVLYWSSRDGEDRPKDFTLGEAPGRKRIFLIAQRMAAK